MASLLNLQALVEVDLVNALGLADLLQVRLDLGHREGGGLREDGAAERRAQGKHHARQQHGAGRLEDGHAPQQRRALQALHHDGRHEHGRHGHEDAAGHHLAQRLLGGLLALANGLARGVLHVDALDDLALAHERDVHAVGGGHGNHGHEAAHDALRKRRRARDGLVERERRGHGGRGRAGVGLHELVVRHAGRRVAVRVVHDRVEALVHPLPENHRRRRAVERHHATRDGHVTRHLGGLGRTAA
mmetsp:Transcript_9221/g.26983  ORF Transcript_9221/g.26983 Transcript_9221/m.26983 type:complete len:245 (+) Transcript_9221:410-1144(+)